MIDTHSQFTSTSLQARGNPAKASKNGNATDEQASSNEPAAEFLKQMEEIEEQRKLIDARVAGLKDQARAAVAASLQQALTIIEKSDLNKLNSAGTRILNEICSMVQGKKAAKSKGSLPPITSRKPQVGKVSKEEKAELWFGFFEGKKRGDTFTNLDIYGYCKKQNVTSIGSPAQFFGKLWDTEQIEDSLHRVEGTRIIVWKLKKAIKKN